MPHAGQEAAQATRRSEAAEERCKVLSEALRTLVGYERRSARGGHLKGCDCRKCADFDRARALLEES